MNISAVRHFWDRGPCNARHSQVDVSGDPLLYSQQVTARKYRVESHLVTFSEFGMWNGKSVLDLGCGIGTQAISFALAGADVVAVDLSPVSVEIAAKRVRAHGLGDQVRLICANAERLGELLSPRHYDLIYAWGSIHHTPNPKRVLTEVQRFMEPASVLKVMIYHRWSVKGLQILRRHGGWLRPADSIGLHSEAQQGSPVTWLYSRAEARKLFSDFEIESLHVDHIFPYQISAYINGEYVREWYWQMIPDYLFRWLERNVGWHLMVTARRRREVA